MKNACKPLTFTDYVGGVLNIKKKGTLNYCLSDVCKAISEAALIARLLDASLIIDFTVLAGVTAINSPFTGQTAIFHFTAI